MKKIIVYADFDFLTSPEEIGTLGYEIPMERCMLPSSRRKRTWKIRSSLSTSHISLRPRLASTWQRRAPSRFQRTVTCFFLNASIEQQKAIAYTLLLLCRYLVLMMELAAAQATAILTLLISSFVGVPMCARISENFIAEWHSTSCLATPTTTSAIMVSCSPQKAGHYRLHTISTQEPSRINACS